MILRGLICIKTVDVVGCGNTQLKELRKQMSQWPSSKRDVDSSWSFHFLEGIVGDCWGNTRLYAGRTVVPGEYCWVWPQIPILVTQG